MLSTRQIIALKEINGCGAATIRQIVSESRKLGNNLSSDIELWEFLNECFSKGLKTCRLKSVSRNDLFEATLCADKIIEKSIKYGISALSYIDPDFPRQLLNTVNEEGKEDVPIILYYKGNISISKLTGIAIIGTREPTKEGLFAGEFFGEKLAGEGYNIVSGLAVGCDAAGHRGALKCADGRTTAFLAHGLDTICPPENTKLANDIVEHGGLLMSEYPIGEGVNRYNPVARDRLQASLSSVTIVIQTGINGGTNHAANATLVSHKPLFCVKYGDESLMNQEKVAGNKALVSKGAKYITGNDYLALIQNSLNTQTSNQQKSEEEPQELLLFPLD